MTLLRRENKWKIMSKNNIGYIIPIHEFVEERDKPLLEACLESIAKSNEGYDYRIYVVGPKDINHAVSGYGVDFIPNGGPTSIQSQINKAVSETSEDWLAYIEYDDVLNDNYRKVFEEYAEHDPDMDMLLALGLAKDYKSGTAVNFFNTQFWSPLYSEDDYEIGKLTLPSLEAIKESYVLLMTFLCGSVARRPVWELGIKPHIIQSFLFEFLIRVVKMGKNVRVSNQCNYMHHFNRSGSFSQKYFSGSVTEMAMTEWVEEAFKEYTKEAVINDKQ